MKNKSYVYVMYESKFPYLPLIVSDDANDIADFAGIPVNSVYNYISRHKDRPVKRYAIVDLSDLDE